MTNKNQCLTEIEAQPEEREEMRGAMRYLQGSKALVYALRYSNGVFYATSDREVLTSEGASERWLVTGAPDVPARLSSEALAPFRDGAETPDGGELFGDVARMFREHLYLPSPHSPSLLAAWVMATYQFRLFTYFPYLAITSATKGCGKSLLEEILGELAWNATAPQTDPTPAVIFRDIHANSCTLILDEVEALRNAEKEKRAALMGLLNVGFKSNAVVKRNESTAAGGYNLRAFDAYSPKVFAGINTVADTVRHRSLEIRMSKRPRGVSLKRFSVKALLGELQALRDRLHLWGLGTASTVMHHYDLAQKMPLPVGLDDRAKDILEPLFSVAVSIGESEVRLLRYAAEEVAGHRAEAEPESSLIMAVGALWSLFEENHSARHVLRTAEAVELFRRAGLNVGDADAQHLLRQLGFESKSNRKGEESVRGYRVDRTTIEELCGRYLPPAATTVADAPQVESLV